MTKKDYVLIAEAIEHEATGWKEELKYGNGLNELGAIKCLAEELAERLETENPRFDREKFLKACGVEA